MSLLERLFANVWFTAAVKVVAAFALLMVVVILLVWAERKIVADMQNRIGPNRAGPWGLLQTVASVEHGLWYARSPEIASGPVIRVFSWMRLVPDVIFASGAILLLAFLVRAIWLSFIQGGRTARAE